MTSKTSNDRVKYEGHDIRCAFHLTPEYVYRKLPLCIVKSITQFIKGRLQIFNDSIVTPTHRVQGLDTGE